jgi:hypothetical protein
MGVDVDRLLSHASAALVGGGLYLTGDDNLRITTIGALAGAVLAIEGRLVNPDGTPVPFAERHVPSSAYASTAQIIPISEGILTHLQVRATTGSALRGHVFAVVEVVRGGGSNAQPLGTILQGYVTATQRLAWPGSPMESSTAGVGRLRLITGTDPAANVEISETVPAGVRWRLYSVVYNFITDATVANRDVNLILDDGTNEIWKAGGASTQVASINRTYYAAAAGYSPALLTNGVTVPLPEALYLASGYRIRTSTNARQAGDNFGAPVYLVEEWLEG